MVKKPQRRIASKPSPPPAADEWVSSGGVDPEVQPSISSPQEPEQQESQREGKDKPFPHRISFDTDTPQYKRLKRAAFEEDRAMNEILREAVEAWLEMHKQ